MIKYDFKCEICQAKFDSESNIPKVLQCGHTLCSKCLERMKTKNISRCPYDRKIIDPDDEKISINYYILHLIDHSVKESVTEIEDKEEVFKLSPMPVINTPGWKNTLDGFIHGDILYTVESNGFIYCTDLNTGEWWFLYLNVFYDQYGNLFRMFNKNYYTQFGRKSSWKHTTLLTIFKNKLYSLETSEKLYATDLENGSWKEITPSPPNEYFSDKQNKHLNLNCARNSNNNDNDNENYLRADSIQNDENNIDIAMENEIDVEEDNDNLVSENDYEIVLVNAAQNLVNPTQSDNQNRQYCNWNLQINENINDHQNDAESNDLQTNQAFSPTMSIINNNAEENLINPNTENVERNAIVLDQNNVNKTNENNSSLFNQRNITNENNDLPSSNPNPSHDNREVRPNRFSNTNELDSDLDSRPCYSVIYRNHPNNSFSNNNGINIERMNIDSIIIRPNSENNFIFNNNNTNTPVRNILSASPNVITPIKMSKMSPEKETISNYNFSNAVALFSNSDNLFLLNKNGEIFIINEETGEIELQAKHFSKNIECFSYNSTHFYLYEKDSKYLYRAAIVKNKYLESSPKRKKFKEIENSKKTLCDKESNLLTFSKNFTNTYKEILKNKNNYDYADIQNIPKGLNFPSGNQNINFYICSHCQSCNNTNEEVKKNEINLIKEKENSYYKEETININCRDKDFEINMDSKSLDKNINIDFNYLKQNKTNEENNINNLVEKEAFSNENKISKFTAKLSLSNPTQYNIPNIVNKKNSFSSNINSDYLKIEKFYELEDSIIPTKMFCDDKKLVIINKTGELNKIQIENRSQKKFQCLFMLRNCHLNNCILIGEGDLILLDPVRLSLNKLNIISGTEIIILHSVKFLASIKHLFANNSKIYFIDMSGNLYHFSEFDKKIIQIGNSGLCKYIVDFTVHKNYLFTIENNYSLYRTNLHDGVYREFDNEYIKNYSHFLSDNSFVVFITKDDFVNVLLPNNEELALKKKFKFSNISKHKAITIFKKQIIFYNNQMKTIESINITEEEIKSKVLVENFFEVISFINNNDCLACILNNCVIYKLFY